MRATVKSQVTPIWNTLAVIPGHIQDEVVVIGNHRDGTCSRLEFLTTYLTQFCSLGNGLLLDV